MKNLPAKIIAICLLFASASAMAQQQNIVGLWKIEKIEISATTPSDKFDKIHPYFQDLYEHKLGLLFSNNGVLNYENYGNEYPVYYSVQGNQLVLSNTKEQAANAKLKSNAVFEVSVSSNKMTLTKAFDTHTETYTLIK
jgi:hypothetical protein